MGPLHGALSPLTVPRIPLATSPLIAPQAWYDFTQNTFADTGATTPAAVGQAVARWDDKRGNGYYLNQINIGSRPTLAANGMNFSGGRLTMSAADRELTKNISYYAAIFVLAPAAGGTDQRFISHSISASTSSSRITFGRNGNTLRLIARALDNDGTVTTSAAWSPTMGQFYVVTVIVDYANRTGIIRVNGTTLLNNPTFLPTTSSTSNAASAAGHLGAEPIGSGSFFMGTMKEIQQYNTPLTLPQISDIEITLSAKYTIA